MRWTTTADIAYGLLIAYVGVYHLWLYSKRSSDRSNFWFSVVSLAALNFAFMQGLYYELDSHPRANYLNRLPLVGATWVVLALLCYGRSLTHLSRRFAWTLGGLAAGLAPVIFFTPWFLGDEMFIAPGDAYRRPLHIHEWALPGRVFGILLVLSLFDVVRCLWERLRAGDRAIRPVLWAFAIFLVTGVNDLLFSSGAIGTLFLTDLGFVVLILGIAASHGIRFAALHDEVARHRERLEQEVAERTAQLQGTVARLEDLAAEQSLLLENTGDFLYRRDARGRIEYISSSVERISGFSPAELLGAPEGASWLFYGRYLTDHPMNRNLVRHAASAANAEDWEHPFLIQVFHRDGRRVAVELKERPYYRDGALVGAIGVGRDVTERLATEAEAREIGRRYRAFFEQCPLPAFVVDAESLRFVEFNSLACELFGYDPEELNDLKVYDVADSLTRSQLERAFEVRGLGEDSNFEARVRTKRGEMKDVAVSSRGVEFGGRLVQQVVLIDLTERKRAEEERLRLEAQMQEAQKLESLGVLAGGIAHDFNNLLAAIIGNLDLARLDAGDNPGLLTSLEQAELAARRGADLTELMLAYAGKGRFQVQRVDLNLLIEEMGKLLNVTLGKRAALRFAFSREQAAIVGDINQIRQVVMNLITNAAEAVGDRPGLVEVRTSLATFEGEGSAPEGASQDFAPGRYVALEIRDDGCGMSEETRHRIFEPFFTTKFTGRGLGMAATLGIVRGHRGDIVVDSVPDRGTVVRVYLPAAAPADAEAEDERSRPDPASA